MTCKSNYDNRGSFAGRSGCQGQMESGKNVDSLFVLNLFEISMLLECTKQVHSHIARSYYIIHISYLSDESPL